MDCVDINVSENIRSNIIIKEGLKDNIRDYLGDKKFFLITNTKLKRLYPELVYKFHKDRVIVIKDGEKYKNFKTFEYILDELLKRKIERKDCIVALGGGVVGDVAGYCASSILRGVELIQIPTTLLAMCDASIGGKTGINTKYGKNLIGSFYCASKVLIDPDFIRTLDKYQYKCGLGEILKYALIEQSIPCETKYDLIDFFDKNQVLDIRNQMPYIIKACAHLKATVVQKDRLESGLRKILNFGHTYAHPVETLSNYKKISHGEAVAWGMKCASKISFNFEIIDKDYYDKINNLIDKFEIITHKIKFDKNKIVDLMYQDKKVVDGIVKLLVPAGFAQVELFEDTNRPLLEASML